MAKRHTNRVGSLESLFLRMEELVLANSGADEFEEVFKLLVAKLWDERSGRPGRFRAYESAAETAQVVGGLLREAAAGWPGILPPGSAPGLTQDHLAVCVEALARHAVSGAALAVMDGFFEFLVSRTAKGAKGQFFTPRHVVEFCVRMLRPTADEMVLDPACGSGGFLFHTLQYVRQECGLDADAARRYAAAKLWGFDLDPRAARVAKALMVVAGGAEENVIRLNSLVKPGAADGGLFGGLGDDPGAGLTVEDVCRTRLRRHRGFDLILTNPPFAGEVREPDLLGSYRVARGRDRIERDVLFVERCVELLRPGGRIAVVLPHNKLAAGTWGPLREWLLRETRVLAVVGLGRNTFLPHTHQKAGVVFAQKRVPGSGGRPGGIFFAVSERDGKNTKGELVLRRDADGGDDPWGRVDHDLAEVVDRFHEFSAAGPSLPRV